MLFLRSDNYHFMTHDIQNLSSASKLTACVIVIIISLIYTVKMFLWNCLRIVKMPTIKVHFAGIYSAVKTERKRGGKVTKIFSFSLTWPSCSDQKLFSRFWDEDEQNGTKLYFIWRRKDVFTSSDIYNAGPYTLALL